MDAGRAVSLAETYLALLGPESPPHVIAAYVRFAALYGVPMERILEISGLDVDLVEQMVGEG